MTLSIETCIRRTPCINIPRGCPLNTGFTVLCFKKHDTSFIGRTQQNWVGFARIRSKPPLASTSLQRPHFVVPADKKSINWLLFQTSLQRPLSCLRRRRSNIYECVGRLQRRLTLSSVPKVAVVERQERFNCTTLIINNRSLLSLNVVHCLSENSVLQWFQKSYYTLRQTSKATDPAYK